MFTIENFKAWLRKLNELGLKSLVKRGNLDKKTGNRQPDGPLYTLWSILKGIGYTGLRTEDWSKVTIQILSDEVRKLKMSLR